MRSLKEVLRLFLLKFSFLFDNDQKSLFLSLFENNFGELRFFFFWR